jgi:hypothetical protein
MTADRERASKLFKYYKTNISLPETSPCDPKPSTLYRRKHMGWRKAVNGSNFCVNVQLKFIPQGLSSGGLIMAYRCTVE